MKCINFVLGLVCTLAISSAAQADSVVAWGNNFYGQLGDGTTTDHSKPMPVSGMDSGVTAIAGGHFHCLAVQNGGLWAWGLNYSGQLGDGTTTTRLTPVPVSGMGSGVTAIAAGGFSGQPDYAQSLAVQNGAALAWGQNNNGQLGDGTTTTRLTPVPVSGMGSGVTAIAAGTFHTLAVQNGKLWAWGSNDNGALGIGVFPTGLPQNLRYPTPVAVIGMDSGVTAVTAGRSFSLALKDGSVYSWGRNASGQLGNGSFVLRTNTPQLVAGLESGATSVAAGYDFSLAAAGGHAYFWGEGGGVSTPVMVDPTNLSNIVAVAAAYEAAYALSSDGSLWSWNIYQSRPYAPQQLLPPSGYKFTSIAAGIGNAVATLRAIPEPSTLLLAALATAGICWRRRRPT